MAKHGDVEAIFITETGTPFDFFAKSPHENFLTLRWKSGSSKEKDILVDFVYFGHYKNKVIYHATRIEETSEYV